MKKILINLNSIKFNPDYKPMGTREYVSGYEEISFSCDKLPSFLINEKNCIITEWKEDMLKGEKYNIKGKLTEMITMDMMEQVKKEKGINLTISIQRNSIEITGFLDSPMYLYEYSHKMVKCKECGVVFNSNDLQYYSTEGCDCCGCGFTSTNTGCPECREYDCVDIEFETIHEALKRTKRKIV